MSSPEQQQSFRVTYMGFPVDLVSVEQALQRVRSFFVAEETASALHVVTLNPEMLMQGEADPELGRILKNAELVIPDGAGLVAALRLNGHSLKRLPGIEFSENLLSHAASAQLPVAVIGARQEVLEAAIANLQAKCPGLSVVYARNGFIADEAEMAQCLQDCLSAQPKIVLVAMGVPRQEKWIAQYRARFSGTVFVGVGGSLDVWSGQSKRAPAWMRALNLEWLYRITLEPWRIQRVSKTLPMFVVKVCLDYGSKLFKS